MVSSHQNRIRTYNRDVISKKVESYPLKGIENTKDHLETLTEINQVYIHEGICEGKVWYKEGVER